MKFLLSILAGMLAMNGVFVLALMTLDSSIGREYEMQLVEEVTGLREEAVPIEELSGTYGTPSETLVLREDGVLIRQWFEQDFDLRVPVENRGRWSLEGTTLRLDFERGSGAELSVGRLEGEVVLVRPSSFLRGTGLWRRKKSD